MSQPTDKKYSVTLRAGDGNSTKKFKDFQGVEQYLKGMLGMSLDDFTEYRIERTVDWEKVLTKKGWFQLEDDNGRTYVVKKKQEELDESDAMDEFLKSGKKIQQLPPGKEPSDSEKSRSLASSMIGQANGGRNAKRGKMMGLKVRTTAQGKKPVIGENSKPTFKEFLYEAAACDYIKVGKKVKFDTANGTKQGVVSKIIDRNRADVESGGKTWQVQKSDLQVIKESSGIDMWTADSGDYDKDHPETFHTIGNYRSKQEAEEALAKCKNKRIMGSIYKKQGPASWLKQGPK